MEKTKDIETFKRGMAVAGLQAEPEKFFDALVGETALQVQAGLNARAKAAIAYMIEKGGQG